MGEDKQGVSMAVQKNPLTHTDAKFNEIKTFIKTWLAKQSLPVEAAIVTVTSAARGAATGVVAYLFKTAYSALSHLPRGNTLKPHSKASFKQAQARIGGPLVHARDFAVMAGVEAGISCVLRRLRGKEDVETTMVAAFGSGVIYSLVSGMGGPNQAAEAISTGVLFVLIEGGYFKVKEKWSKPKVEDMSYTETRGMLSSLGLGCYEENFKRGLLTDKTLPLLTYSALQDVKIPVGPRLLILDHIEREKEVKKWGA